jgi:hypothetical protein
VPRRDAVWLGISCNHLPDVSKVRRLAREVKAFDSQVRVVIGGQTATVLVDEASSRARTPS